MRAIEIGLRPLVVVDAEVFGDRLEGGATDPQLRRSADPGRPRDVGHGRLRAGATGGADLAGVAGFDVGLMPAGVVMAFDTHAAVKLTDAGASRAARRGGGRRCPAGVRGMGAFGTMRSPGFSDEEIRREHARVTRCYVPHEGGALVDGRFAPSDVRTAWWGTTAAMNIIFGESPEVQQARERVRLACARLEAIRAEGAGWMPWSWWSYWNAKAEARDNLSDAEAALGRNDEPTAVGGSTGGRRGARS